MQPTYVQMLLSADESDRRYALEDLASAQDWNYLPQVLPLLEDVSIAVREAAAEVLVQSKSAEGIAWAMQSLASPNVKTRNLAAEILTGIGDKALTSLMNLGFEHLDPDVRKLSLDIVCTMGHLRRDDHPELFKALEKRLDDANLNVACSAIEVFGSLKDALAVPLLLRGMSGEEWKQCCIVEALISISGEASLSALKLLTKKSISGPAKIRVDTYLAESEKSGKAS